MDRAIRKVAPFEELYEMFSSQLRIMQQFREDISREFLKWNEEKAGDKVAKQAIISDIGVVPTTPTGDGDSK